MPGIPEGCVSLYKNARMYVPSEFPLEGPRIGGLIDEDGELRLWSSSEATAAETKTKTPAWHIPYGLRVHIQSWLEQSKFKPKAGHYEAEMIDGVVCVDLTQGPLSQKQSKRRSRL